MHWVPNGQTVNKEYYVEVLREFRKRFLGRSQHSSNRTSGISTWTMHQSTTPSLSLTIWPRRASRQILTLPIVETLLPVTFGYSLSSEAVVMRQLRRWKRLWWRSLTRSHKRTSMAFGRSCWNVTTSALQPEEITSKGTSFMCVLSIKVPIRKKSLETYLMIFVNMSSNSDSCEKPSTNAGGKNSQQSKIIMID